METALSSLKNQSTWLAGQINSLPSYVLIPARPRTIFPTLQEKSR